MNKIQFTNRYYYLALTSTLFLVIFFQAFTATVTGNTFGFIPVVVEFVLIFLIALRHEYTQVVLAIWASVFMLLSSLIKIIFKFVTQSGNLSGGFEFNSIYLNAIFMTLGLLAWLGGRYFIVEQR